MASSRLRLALPGRAETGLTDALTGDQAAVWDADALDIEFWLGSECAGEDPFDIDLITSLSLEFRLTDTTTALLIAAQTVLVADMDECDLDDWKDDDGQHGTFALTGTMMNFANGVKRFWASFRALLTDGTYKTFAAGYIKVASSFHGSSADPTEGSAGGYLYITSATPDADGMYAVTFRGKTGRIIISDVTP